MGCSWPPWKAPSLHFSSCFRAGCIRETQHHIVGLESSGCHTHLAQEILLPVSDLTRSWKGGGLWLYKARLIHSSVVHFPACLIHSHLFSTSICRGSKRTPVLPMSDKMRKHTFLSQWVLSTHPSPFRCPPSYQYLEPKHEGRVPTG